MESKYYFAVALIIQSMQNYSTRQKHMFYRAATTHKVIPKNSTNPVKKVKKIKQVKNIQPTPKSTVFEQLDKLKRFLRASGIKLNVNDLLKGNFNLQSTYRVHLHCAACSVKNVVRNVSNKS